MKNKAIEPQKTLITIVCETLRRQIEDGRYSRGDELPSEDGKIFGQPHGDLRSSGDIARRRFTGIPSGSRCLCAQSFGGVPLLFQQIDSAIHAISRQSSHTGRIPKKSTAKHPAETTGSQNGPNSDHQSRLSMPSGHPANYTTLTDATGQARQSMPVGQSKSPVQGLNAKRAVGV